MSTNPDGSSLEVLIPFKSGQGEYNPTLSSDGKTVLFNTYRYGGWKLALHDIDTKSVKRITLGSDYYTNGVFSPDGMQIAYEKNLQRSTHIFIADKNGKNERILTDKMGNENRTPIWSSDGKSIVFYSEKGRINDVYNLEVATGKFKSLTANNAGNDFNPSVSPDGKKIAFFSDRNGFLDLYVMNADGSDQQNLTSSIQNENNQYNYFTDSNMYWIFKVSWSPDGKSLVFSNATANNIDLFTISAEGKNIERITNTPESEFTPMWGVIK